MPVAKRFVDFGGKGRGRRAYGRIRIGRGDADGEVGLLVGCPAGYGLESGHCGIDQILGIWGNSLYKSNCK